MIKKPRVFISYRRDDSAYISGGIRDQLENEFGAGSVFFDVDSIDGGEDFVTILEQSLDESDALIVVIGDRWNLPRAGESIPRLEEENDFVRIEIETALQKEIPIIPVLVDKAKMPGASDVPDSIQGLLRYTGGRAEGGPGFVQSHAEADQLRQRNPGAKTQAESKRDFKTFTPAFRCHFNSDPARWNCRNVPCCHS